MTHLLGWVLVLCTAWALRADASRELLSKGLSGKQCCDKLKAANFSSNLPVSIFINENVPIDNIPVPDTTRIPVTVCTCNTSDSTAATSHPGMINQRGSHSQDTNTVKSYEITLNGSHPYLGMPKGKKWVHYGPQNDTLGLHYWYAMEMYRNMKGGYWVPRSRFVEVFMLDSDRPISYPDDYYGLYVSFEHIEGQKNRLNLTKASAQDLTGGYILDNEHNKTRGPLKNETQFTLPRFGITYILREPHNYLTIPMLDYIKGYMISFEDALFSSNFEDPTSGYRKYANVTSMIDYMLAEELQKNNNDGYRGSQFLWKNAGGLLNFGPAWGLDDGFGTCCGFPAGNWQSANNFAIQPEGWMFATCDNASNCVTDPLMGIEVWYRRAWKDPAFRTAVALREKELRAGPWSDVNAAATLDNAVAYIHEAGLRTLKKWGPVDACPREECETWPSYQAEIDSAVGFMKNWTLTRLNWFDGALAPYLPGNSNSSAPQPTVALAGR